MQGAVMYCPRLEYQLHSHELDILNINRHQELSPTYTCACHDAGESYSNEGLCLLIILAEGGGETYHNHDIRMYIHIRIDGIELKIKKYGCPGVKIAYFLVTSISPHTITLPR